MDFLINCCLQILGDLKNGGVQAWIYWQVCSSSFLFNSISTLWTVTTVDVHTPTYPCAVINVYNVISAHVCSLKHPA